MKFARYSTMWAVSSPTGLIKCGGRANPYCNHITLTINTVWKEGSGNSQFLYLASEQHMNILCLRFCTSSQRCFHVLCKHTAHYHPHGKKRNNPTGRRTDRTSNTSFPSINSCNVRFYNKTDSILGVKNRRTLNIVPYGFRSALTAPNAASS